MPCDWTEMELLQEKSHFRAACLKLKGKKTASVVTTGESGNDDDVGDFWLASDCQIERLVPCAFCYCFATS